MLVNAFFSLCTRHSFLQTASKKQMLHIWQWCVSPAFHVFFSYWIVYHEVNVFVIWWFVYFLTKRTILNIWHLIQRGTDVNSSGLSQDPYRTLIIVELLTTRGIDCKIRLCLEKDFAKVMYRKFVCNWRILNIIWLENNFCLQNSIAWRIVTITD